MCNLLDVNLIPGFPATEVAIDQNIASSWEYVILYRSQTNAIICKTKLCNKTMLLTQEYT